MSIGDIVRTRRTELGLSQRHVADVAGLSRSYLCDIEQGRAKEPTFSTVRALAKVLTLNPQELIAGELPLPQASDMCRHYGIEWTNPISRSVVRCVACGQLFDVVRHKPEVRE